MEFNSIETPNLIVRRLEQGDAAALSAYRSQSEVAKYQSWESYSPERALELIKESEGSEPSIQGRWFQFGLELKETGALVGDIGFCHKDSNGDSWVGFTLDSSFWGRGLATEAVGSVIDHYRKLGVARVKASVDPQNLSSKKLLSRLGFVLIEHGPDDHVYLKEL